MAVHLTFALIHNNTVANIAAGTYTDCDAVAKDTYGPEAYAVDITHIPAEIGDTCISGVFTRDGVVIEPELSEEQAIKTLLAQNEALQAQVDLIALSILDIVGMEEEA